MATAVTGRCKPGHLNILSAFFTPQFVSQGLFSDAFNGSATVSRDLDLPNYVDMLLLGRQTVLYSTNAGLNNLVSANMHLDLNAMPVGAWGQNQGWTFIANGAGFRPGDARAMAEERLAKQIARTNFDLGQSSPSGQ
ncbi:MAG: hypothetical protein ACLQVX_18800 [Limisphaerales bacterium]